MDSEELPKAEETVEEPKPIEETEGEKPETNEPKLARVEYDYEARDSDELSLSKGDVITIMEQGEEGWWKGDLNGKIGLFPENHVKLIEVSSQLTEDDEDAENPEGKKKKTLNKYGVKPGGIGSLFSEGKFPSLKKRSLESSTVSEEKNVATSAPVLKKTSLPSPMNQQPSLPLPHLPPKKKPPKPKKVELKASVIHNYEADDEDEISLKSGSHVVILDKIDDDGWWKGINEQGQVGLFPSGYVKEILQTEVQQESQPSSEGVNESSEASVVTTQEEVFTSEPAPASTDSPPSSIHSSSHDMYDVHNEDSPKSPSPPMRRTTNETSSPTTPTTPNRRSTHESSQAASPKRRSINESTSRKNSSHDGEHVTSRRPPSLVSPDLPPIQPISTNLANIDTSPTSPEERPTVPSRQLSRSSSLYENKTDSQKSPTLAKPPSVPKSFSPTKTSVPPVRRSSSSVSKSDKVKTETSPTEPISPKIDRRASHDHSTALPDPEDKDDEDGKDDDYVTEDVEQTDEVVEEHEETIVDKKAEILEEEVVNDDEKVITETVETKDEEEQEEQTISGHEVELEEKKSQPQLPPLPSGPKLTSLGKDRPAIKNRKVPSVKNVKEIASQSQTATLLESVASAKDEAEQKPQPVALPPKPEKPIKPNSFKLPTLGTGVQLRSVPKKPPIETSTESTEATKDPTTPSGIDTRPTGGVRGLSSRFQGIPNSSSDVEFRLKKWFNEEINKVKSQFEARLAEERSKREALEETLEQLIASLQN